MTATPPPPPKVLPRTACDSQIVTTFIRLVVVSCRMSPVVTVAVVDRCVTLSSFYSYHNTYCIDNYRRPKVTDNYLIHVGHCIVIVNTSKRFFRETSVRSLRVGVHNMRISKSF